MEWLNYHHLLYFWTVAREGTIAKASEVLLLAPPTISEQIRDLEGSLGVKLFRKQGRNLVLTDAGCMLQTREQSHTASKLKFVLTSFLSNGDERKDMIWMIGCRQNLKQLCPRGPRSEGWAA
jgi:Bacterial regulatory helix-turn-helix protein, lysR family